MKRLILICLVLCGTVYAAPPAKTTNPSPDDDATGVAVTAVLTWDTVAGADDYNVYLSRNGRPIVYAGNVDVNSYDPPALGGGIEYQWRIDPNNEDGATTGDVWTFTTDPAYTLTFTGATGVSAVTPKFTFSSGTVAVYVNDVFVVNLTSGVEATGANDIDLTVGQTLEYRCSAWNAVTQIDIATDKVSGSFPAIVWPTGLTHYHCYTTSITGDVSSTHWPSGLQDFRFPFSSVTGDISSVNWPNSLIYFSGYGTSVTGDISSANWPSSLTYFSCYSTSVTGDISSANWPSGLTTFSCNSTSVTYGTGGGASTIGSGFTKVDADDCGWDYLQVNRLLVDLAASGRTSKAVDCAGTNAAPSQTGETARALLASRSWTLSVKSAVAQAPFKAAGPSPSNGAMDVDLDTTLTWGSAYDASDYLVYLNDFLIANVATTSYSPILTYGSTYFWRIDPNHVDGGSTTGDVWSFTTMADPTVEPEPQPDLEPDDAWRRVPTKWRAPTWRKR